MGYYYNRSGKLVFSQSYVSANTHTVRQTSNTSTVKTDSIRPMSLYVESHAKVDNGHLAQWTGSPAMFSSTGQKINTFTAQTGHEFALSQIEACDEVHSKKVAGVVIDHVPLQKIIVFCTRVSMTISIFLKIKTFTGWPQRVLLCSHGSWRIIMKILLMACTRNFSMVWRVGCTLCESWARITLRWSAWALTHQLTL